MFLMYVDESGDVGLTGSPAKYFCLCGLVVHELRWLDTLDSIVAFRRKVRPTTGLKLRDEIHAAEMVRSPGALPLLQKWQRLMFLGDVLTFMSQLPDVSLISVRVDKTNKTAGYDVFEHAWEALLQRFHNTISYRNFPGPSNPDDRGLVVCDATDAAKLQRLLRKMRRFNIVPGMAGLSARQIPLRTIVEDPVHRDSRHSYLLQLVDVAAYFLHQSFAPNGYVRRKGARNYFKRLDPILCKVASPSTGGIKLL